MNKFVVKINNLVFSDFEMVSVKKSMEHLSGATMFSTINFFEQKQKLWDIYLEQSFSAYINDELVIKGFVDEIGMSYDSKKSDVTVFGRDNTAILVDCCWDNSSNEWKKRTILDIVSYMCSAYGITVSVDSSASSLVARNILSFKINEGEKVFDAIKRICIENSILPLSYGDGKLILTSVSPTRKATDSIEYGNNIESCRAVHSNINRFNSYKVKGLGQESDFKSLADYLQPVGTASDSVISNSYRTFVHLSDVEIDNGSAINQAKFIRNVHAGKARGVYYKVKDWKQSDGSLWKQNSLVGVNDPVLKIKKQMLISEVNFLYNKVSGWSTGLVLVPRETFNRSDNPIKVGFDV